MEGREGGRDEWWGGREGGMKGGRDEEKGGEGREG